MSKRTAAQPKAPAIERRAHVGRRAAAQAEEGRCGGNRSRARDDDDDGDGEDEQRRRPTASAGEIRRLMGDFLTDFEEFKEKNDERLEALEGRGARRRKGEKDPVRDEALDRLNTNLTRRHAELRSLMTGAPTLQRSRREERNDGAPFGGVYLPAEELLRICPDFPIESANVSHDGAVFLSAEEAAAYGCADLANEIQTVELQTSSDRRRLDTRHGRREPIIQRRRFEVPGLEMRAGDPRARGAAATQYRNAFRSYMRRGDERSRMFLETRALSVGSNPDGGYTALPEVDQMINRAVEEVSPIRSIATVREIGASAFKKFWQPNGASSGWVGEVQARPETDAPEMNLLEYPTMELYAMPAASQSLLDDSFVDIEQWLADEVQMEFAQREGAAFVAGNGVSQPKGFLSYDTIADGSFDPGAGHLGFVITGDADNFADDDGADALIELVYSPLAAYRQNGRFVMNRATQAAVRKLKDGDGNYLWQPGLQNGQPASLLGYPITEAEDMPDLGANEFPIAFGDFERGYLVVDRMGVRVLRDPYTAKPFVLFYTTKRVGGGVQNFQAIKLLKCAAA